MGKRIEYPPGAVIGSYGVVFIEEIPKQNKIGYILEERRMIDGWDSKIFREYRSVWIESAHPAT